MTTRLKQENIWHFCLNSYSYNVYSVIKKVADSFVSAQNYTKKTHRSGSSLEIVYISADTIPRFTF